MDASASSMNSVGNDALAEAGALTQVSRFEDDSGLVSSHHFMVSVATLDDGARSAASVDNGPTAPIDIAGIDDIRASFAPVLESYSSFGSGNDVSGAATDFDDGMHGGAALVPVSTLLGVDLGVFDLANDLWDAGLDGASNDLPVFAAIDYGFDGSSYTYFNHQLGAALSVGQDQLF